VGVLFGGQSGEHEVSLASARSVIEALEARGGYEVVPVGITPEGKWIASPDALDVLAREASFLLPGWQPAAATPDSLPSGERRSAALLPDGSDEPLVRLDDPAIPGEHLDVVFPVLHGPRGEDGTVQGFLELAGIPYVGCGVAASAVAMDKHLAKSVLASAGIPVVPWETVRAHDWDRDRAAVERRVSSLGFPCFVKPANMGSSVGISKAHDPAGLRAGIDEALRYDVKVIVERGIDAREIECSVLGNDEPRASVPGEIVPSNEFYDYDAKYLAEDPSELIIPAKLTEEQATRVRELALRAFTALDGAGMARVDFLLDRTSGELFLNELNTIPGFTSISMYSKLWEASGLGYPELVEELIRLALERHGRRGGLQVRYTPAAGPGDGA
jgi:D-alanine-D-alanine ligase